MNAFKKRPLLLSVSLAAGFLLVLFACYCFAIIYPEKIKAHPARYCYETFRGPINSTLYLTSLGDSSAYIQYYQEVQAGKNPIINFPLNGLDPDVPVYVQDYVGRNASLAEVVSYEENHSKARPYLVRCYVYSPTLHKKPPSYQH